MHAVSIPDHDMLDANDMSTYVPMQMEGIGTYQSREHTYNVCVCVCVCACVHACVCANGFVKTCHIHTQSQRMVFIANRQLHQLTNYYNTTAKS